MLRFRSALGLGHRTIMGIRIIPTAITGHTDTIMGRHTNGMAGIGTGATTVITATIGINGLGI